MAAKPPASTGAAQRSVSPLGQRSLGKPRARASRCTISPHTMNGQNEHQSRPTRG